MPANVDRFHASPPRLVQSPPASPREETSSRAEEHRERCHCHGAGKHGSLHAMRTLALIPLIVRLLGPICADAAVFPVTKTADTADDACDADCSLREAILAANALPGPDEIMLPAGTYMLSLVASGTGKLGTLVIADDGSAATTD